MSDSVPQRSSAPYPSLVVIDRDDDHVFLAYANVLIAIWHGHQHPHVCHRMYDAAIAAANQTGAGKVAALSIIQPGIRPPSARSREALARLIEDEVRVVHRSALVYPDDGFLASIIRSIALGLMQRAARKKNHQVFQQLGKALEWVTAGLPTANNRPIANAPLLHLLETHLAPSRSKVA